MAAAPPLPARLPAGLQGLRAGGCTVLFRGAPVACGEGEVANAFAKYGPVERVTLFNGLGCGFVEFGKSAAAEKAAADSGHFEVRQTSVQLARALPQLAVGGAMGGAPRALVAPAVGRQPLDVVVIRGRATATAVGVAALLARAKTTTIVLWDRRHVAGQGGSAKPSVALQKRTYATCEEERPDALVMGKAFEFFGTGAPRCALLHVASDSLKKATDVERPLWHVDEVMAGCNDNHCDTLQCFYAAMVYQPWIHAYKACVFHLLPPETADDWPGDMCLATTGARRLVKHDSLRQPDGSGFTFGLQMVCDHPPMNASLAHAYMMSCVFANDGTKHEMSGKSMSLDMPLAERWFKLGSSKAAALPA